jgi:phosphoribosylformylglycinamidine synthase
MAVEELIVGIQDMGAAGLTCSSLEMAGRAGTGIDLDLDRVPLREESMTPYEIMLSESQERMLLVVQKGREEEALEIYGRWGLDAVVVGQVAEGGRLTVSMGGNVIAQVPVKPLYEGLPCYDRPQKRPSWQDDVQNLDASSVPEPENAAQALRELLTAPNMCSAEWIWTQYDHQVRTDTVLGPGGDAAVMRIEGGEPRSIAMAADGNGRQVFLDPRRGAALAVCEAARNVSCTGAKPLAITNCLNFGNPERPEIMWQFAEVVDGMAEACRELNLPVTGGNVSFYNETRNNAIHPTPVVIVVGVLEDAALAVPSHFVQEGDAVVLLGEPAGRLDGSQYLATVHGIERGRPDEPDYETERNLTAILREGAARRLLVSAHDVSEGGICTALAECGFRHWREGEPLGCEVELPDTGRRDELLFGEAPARVIVTCRAAAVDDLLQLAGENGTPALRLGEVKAGRLTIRRNDDTLVDESVFDLHAGWREALEGHLGSARVPEEEAAEGSEE